MRADGDYVPSKSDPFITAATVIDHSSMMTGSYDPLFVVLSVVIAALASYAALDLAGRVRSAEGSTRLGWLAGGATVMGLGIWSMHFVAMLAFRLPIPIEYELRQILLSVVVAIAASLLALIVVSRVGMRATTLVMGGILMGGAIAGMHYIGMASMTVGATLTYSSSIVALSIFIAIVASWAALGLAFNFRSDLSVRGRWLKSLSAVAMGVAIAGMHYTAMAAVHFTPSAVIERPSAHILATGGLAGAVALGTLVILALAIVGSVIDRSMQSKIAFTKELTERTLELAQQVEESKRLTARLEETNIKLHLSLADAYCSRQALTEEHQRNLELQRAAQLEAVKARWLEGIAETATAVAHEINNPLTSLIINAGMLDEVDSESAKESIAEIRRSARRIALVVRRLGGVITPRSVRYVGESRMLDLSSRD
jgi:NO-binding membrane sensor protein with MHYT domain